MPNTRGKQKEAEAAKNKESTVLHPEVPVASASAADKKSSKRKRQAPDSFIIQQDLPDERESCISTKMGEIVNGKILFTIRNFQAYLRKYSQFDSAGEALALMKSLAKYFSVKVSCPSAARKLFRRNLQDTTIPKVGEEGWQDVLKMNTYTSWMENEGTALWRLRSNKIKNYFNWSSLDGKSHFPQFRDFLCVYVYVVHAGQGLVLEDATVTKVAEEYLKAAHPGVSEIDFQMNFNSMGVEEGSFPNCASLPLVQLPISGLTPEIDHDSEVYLLMKEHRDLFNANEEAENKFCESWEAFQSGVKTLNKQFGILVENFEKYSAVNDSFNAAARRIAPDQSTSDLPRHLITVPEGSSELSRNVFDVVRTKLTSLKSTVTSSPETGVGADVENPCFREVVTQPPKPGPVPQNKIPQTVNVSPEDNDEEGESLEIDENDEIIRTPSTPHASVSSSNDSSEM